MNIIEEQRNRIITENNTAQSRLLDILNETPKSSEVLNITEPLHGDLDFSVLIQEYEMRNIKTISLSKGEITSVVGLPTGLLVFECPENLLTSIENLPITLQTLNLSHNYLEKIDVSNLEALETLNISHNKIAVLENLPPTLKELYFDNNQIASVSLAEIEGLKTLHLSNNPITVIDSLPPGVADFQMENTPDIEFRKSNLDILSSKNIESADTEEDAEVSAEDIRDEADEVTKEEQEQKKNYEDALFEYFQLKNDYEKKVRKMKREAYKKAPTKKMGRQAIASIKPSCINCKRPVGTIFGRRDNNKYIVLCGDAENPCNLNIQIFNEYSTNFIELLYIYYEELNGVKDNIIRQKLDTIFNYTSEEKSIELYKKELELFNDYSGYFKELYDKYTEYYHDPAKKEAFMKKNEKIFLLIEKNRELIEEYKSSQNPELLKVVVKSQIDDIYPEIRNRRLLEGEVMEIDSKTFTNHIEYSLFKYPIEISKIVNTLGEKSRVVKYVYKSV
jgi:hypothetical protein